MKPDFAYPRVAMPVEIEAKMKIDNPETVAARLIEHGATPVGNYREVNTFYDTDDRTLLACDEGLRIRVQEDLNEGKVEFVMTHKGPGRQGRLNGREETELGVESAEEAGLLLERLGYARCLRFEKRRQSWKLDGCEIALDEVPHLGHFVEIEGATEDRVMALREKLGLSDRAVIRAGYVAMLTSYLQERGQATNEVAFPKESTPRIARAC